MGIPAGIKLAKVLKDLVQYGPVAKDLIEMINGLIKRADKPGTQVTEIDKIQTQMMEKITEQNMRMTEAMSLIYTRIKYLAVLSVISFFIAACALVIILIRT